MPLNRGEIERKKVKTITCIKSVLHFLETDTCLGRVYSMHRVFYLLSFFTYQLFGWLWKVKVPPSLPSLFLSFSFPPFPPQRLLLMGELLGEMCLPRRRLSFNSFSRVSVTFSRPFFNKIFFNRKNKLLQQHFFYVCYF